MKVDPLNFAAALNSVMQQPNMTASEAERIVAYHCGHYSFPPPPVQTSRWYVSDWMKYIDAYGHWFATAPYPLAPRECAGTKMWHVYGEDGEAVFTSKPELYAKGDRHGSQAFEVRPAQ